MTTVQGIGQQLCGGTNAVWARAIRLNKRPGKLQMEKRLYPRSLNDFFFSSMYNSAGDRKQLE